jgi:hypothetical protein
MSQLKKGMMVRAIYGRVNRSLGLEHTGEVLAVDDPRAWTDTLAFPGRTPTADEVKAHVEQLHIRPLVYDGRVPVLWSFGKVYWETADNLAEVSQ